MELWFAIATVSSLCVIGALIVYCFVWLAMEALSEKGVGE